MTWAGISSLSPWVWLWDSSSSPVFSRPLHTACCSPFSEGHPRGTTSRSCIVLAVPARVLPLLLPAAGPPCRQVPGHLLYPEDGRQPGTEALCREKTGGAHITLRSLLPPSKDWESLRPHKPHQRGARPQASTQTCRATGTGPGEGGDNFTPWATTQAGLCHVAVPRQVAWPPSKDMDSWIAQKLSTAQGRPENSSHRYFSHCPGQELCRGWEGRAG